MSIAKVHSRGQVTLPKEARERAGIRPGDMVTVQVLRSGELRLTVLPRLTPDELRERYRIDQPIDWERDRELAEAEAADEVFGR